MTQSQHDLLNEPFPDEVLGELPKAGKKLSFVPVAEVISRLNTVLGIGNWSYTLMDHWREDDFKGNPWVMAHVNLAATIMDADGNEVRTTRSGIGGYDHSNRGMDLADAYKSAVSEALKKAAQTMGVGLHLSRKEEAIAMDAIVDKADDEDVREFRASMSSESKEVRDATIRFAKNDGVNWKNMSELQLEGLQHFVDAFRANAEPLPDEDGIGPEETQ
jgi:hypothetical protein